MTVSKVGVLSDWAVDGHDIPSVQLVKMVAHAASFEVALRSVKLDQDVYVALLTDSADRSVRSFNFDSILIRSATN